MKVVKINKYQFKYDDGNMFCFEDSDNNKIAFINGSEIQLIIDINNNRLTFHPSQSVNIYELDEYTYKIRNVLVYYSVISKKLRWPLTLLKKLRAILN